MEGAVERRTHQLGHAGVDDDELARRRCAASRRSRGRQSAPAGAAIERPGSTTIGSDVRADCVDECADILSRRWHVAAVVRHAEPAADVDVFERGTPAASSSRLTRGGQRRGLAQRIERRDLRSDVHVDRDQPQQRAAPAASASSARASSSGTPNLLIFRPVEMCGWLFASMSGFTRIATRARRAQARPIASSARQLARPIRR